MHAADDAPADDGDGCRERRLRPDEREIGSDSASCLAEVPHAVARVWRGRTDHARKADIAAWRIPRSSGVREELEHNESDTELEQKIRKFYDSALPEEYNR